MPLSLMTGNTGRLFREFAITMAAAMLISMFVSLTVVPMACSRFLEVKHRHGVLWRAIERVISGTQHAYDRLLGWFLRQRVVVAVFFALSMAGTIFLITALPRTLVPVEDRGSFMTIIRAPQGSTTAYTERAMKKIEDMVQKIPEVESYFAAVSFGFGGPGDSSQGIVFTRLKHWSERKVKQQEIVQQLFPQFMAIPEALVFPVNPPSLGQGFRSADVQIAIKSSTASLDEFNDLGRRVVGRLSQIPGLVNVDTDMRLDNPQLDIIVDRERASDLGISVADVAESMRLLVSQGRIDDFILRAKQYDVVTALASRFRTVPEQLGEIHVRAADGTMVPMSSVARAVPKIGAASLTHYDLQRSVTVTANLAPGATLGEVLPPALAAVDEELPAGFTTSLGGVTREYVESAGAIYITFCHRPAGRLPGDGGAVRELHSSLHGDAERPARHPGGARSALPPEPVAQHLHRDRAHSPGRPGDQERDSAGGLRQSGARARHRAARVAAPRRPHPLPADPDDQRDVDPGRGAARVRGGRRRREPPADRRRGGRRPAVLDRLHAADDPDRALRDRPHRREARLSTPSRRWSSSRRSRRRRATSRRPRSRERPLRGARPGSDRVPTRHDYSEKR